MGGNVYVFGKTGQCLIAGIINNFGYQVIRGLKVGVHPWPLAYGLQAAEHFETRFVVFFYHVCF